MSEYTPTTEQIRATYADGESEGTPEDYAEFDRWLAAHDAEVRAQVVAEEPEWGRMVTTGIELNALPLGSIVRDVDGGIYVKDDRLHYRPWFDLSATAQHADEVYAEEPSTILWQATEPRATVLWVPVKQEPPTPANAPCVNCGHPGAVREVVGRVMCDACVESFTAWTQKQEGAET